MTRHSSPHHHQDAIVVEALTKHYGDVRAVDGVSFTVKTGQVFAFLGPNGAGKTTTVEIIEGIRTPTSGRVTVLGMDAAKRKRDIVPRIGVLPQAFNSFDRLTVGESLQYYARLFGIRRVDIDGLLNLANLKGKRGAQFRTLSGGMKQGLGIAIALVNDPEVVFLDEPTTGLDPHARRAVWDVLLGLKNKGKAVFLTTHYMEEAELLADTVAVISKGRLIATGSPDELIEQNADHMTLTIKDASARVFDTIKGMNFTPVRQRNNHITVQVKRTEDLQAILNALKAAGGPLPAVDVGKPNLEEVFLKLTGQELRAGAAAGGEAR